MVSAVSPRGELLFDVQQAGIRKEEFLEFCKKLVAEAGRPVYLIVDNSQVHRSKILKEFVRQSNGMLTVFFLPPYSPDLNPDEWVWKNVKHDNLGRAVAKIQASSRSSPSPPSPGSKSSREKSRDSSVTLHSDTSATQRFESRNHASP